jgi:hypothetical protein
MEELAGAGGRELQVELELVAVVLLVHELIFSGDRNLYDVCELVALPILHRKQRFGRLLSA